MKKIVIFTLFLTSFLNFYSCQYQEKEDIEVAIRSLRVTSSLPISERGDWSLYVNKNKYNTTVNGRTILAKPRLDGQPTYYTIYGKDTMDSLPNITQGSLELLFASPKYPYVDKEKSTYHEIDENAVLEALDQSSYEKMIAMDALTTSYTGWLSQYIDNVKLQHRHNLLTYTIEGLPKDAELKLFCLGKEIKPFIKDGLHSVVLILPHDASLEAVVAGERYVLEMDQILKALPADKRISKDQHYFLDLVYDADSDGVLKVRRIEGDKWSERDLQNHS